MRKVLCIAAALAVVALVPARVDAVWLEGQRPVFTGKIAAVFDTPGSYTWTVPDGVWRIMVEMWGGGARGDQFSGWWGTETYIGSGGSYGFTYIDVTPGMACNIVVGAGGDSDWENGGITSITCGSFYYYVEGGQACAGGGSSNAPFSIQGQECGHYKSNTNTEKDGGAAARGGFAGSWPGGGAATGSAAPGGLVIYY